MNARATSPRSSTGTRAAAGPYTRGGTQSAVEEPAREIADLSRIVDADVERGRPAADGEIGVAELRRHGARRLAARAQMARDLVRHPAQLIVETFAVDEVAVERVLHRDR